MGTEKAKLFNPIPIHYQLNEDFAYCLPKSSTNYKNDDSVEFIGTNSKEKDIQTPIYVESEPDQAEIIDECIFKLSSIEICIFNSLITLTFCLKSDTQYLCKRELIVNTKDLIS